MGRERTIKRDALISDEATAALCPLIAVCVYTDPETRRKVTCGYYHGSTTNGEGTKVVCGYGDENGK